MSRAVDRMVDILDCFSSEEPHLSLADVADRTQLDRATTLRFLNALATRGVLRRDPASKRYTFGMRLIEWGAQAYGSVDLTQAAEPVLRDLMLASDATLTSDDRATVEAQVASARERGYAFTPHIIESRAWSIGCPVFDHQGIALGSITATAPDAELDAAREAHIAHAVLHAARAVSLALRAPRDRWPWGVSAG